MSPFVTIVNGALAVDTERDFTQYDEITRWLGGYLELIPMPSISGRSLFAYIDEEGRIKGLAPNFIHPSLGVIHGPCVILASTENEDGEMVETSLTKGEAESFVLVRRPDQMLPVLECVRPDGYRFGTGRSGSKK